ncbi:response regulator [Alkalimonas mucilaginosa]|uniref:Response regulator n=1 Tax=Alkalimonas mucilaginosa TaxID=3057676 RepID=A0ABU7JHF1_9GAMM|nr:response regulator [Alkalimonas sp. MEB004]MEE2025127.1 response regulator [Alkalimonas sp. MEB004]
MDPSFFRCKQVLIVEDCAPVRATIKSMLQTMGFEAIHLARNSTEALKKCYEIPFDFILCDFNLGDCKDGYQLFEALKQQELISPLCCFMIISAESQRKIVHGMIELQPDDYLLKPFSYPVLEERIVRMVKTKIALRKIYLAIAEQDYALAIAECDKALQAKPELNQTTYRLKGELLLQTKAYKKAENYYRTLKENKNYPWARLGYAIAGFRQERWEDSELELVDLTQFDETKVEALDWLSRLLVKQNRFQRACDTLTEAALLSPKNITRQQTLSNLTSIIGDKEAAARIHSKLVAAARHSIHDTADNYLNHARALIDLAQTKSVMERAVQLQHASQLVTGLSKRFNEALVQQEVQLVRGRILAAKGQLAEAKELIHGITGLKSKKLTIDSCMDAAKAYFEIGDLYESEYYIEEMRRHLAKDDFLTETQQLMLKMEQNRHQELKDKIKTINLEASAAYQHGHYGRASELFHEAFQFMPSNPVIALNMLQAMSKGTGLTAETMKPARQAIALIEQGELSITNQQRYKKYYRTLISKHPELATKTRAQPLAG